MSIVDEYIILSRFYFGHSVIIGRKCLKYFRNFRSFQSTRIVTYAFLLIFKRYDIANLTQLVGRPFHSILEIRQVYSTGNWPKKSLTVVNSRTNIFYFFWRPFIYIFLVRILDHLVTDVWPIRHISAVNNNTAVDDSQIFY